MLYHLNGKREIAALKAAMHFTILSSY